MTVGSEDSIEIGPERAAELLRDGEHRYGKTTNVRRHDGWNPLFRAPTGLAVGLARKGPRYAVR